MQNPFAKYYRKWHNIKYFIVVLGTIINYFILIFILIIDYFNNFTVFLQFNDIAHGILLNNRTDVSFSIIFITCFLNHS